MLSLNFGFTFEDLNSLSGLKRLDESFLQFLKNQDSVLYKKLQNERLLKSEGVEHSEFLLQLAPFVDDFIAELFDISNENLDMKKTHEKFDPIYECRRKFVQRYVAKTYTKEKLQGLDFEQVTESLKKLLGDITELSITEAVLEWQKNPEIFQDELTKAAEYSGFMISLNSSLTLFDVPRAVDENNHIRGYKINQLSDNQYLGFDYRDRANSSLKAYAQAKYCIYCHRQKKDSCSKGLDIDKKGCPLKQKISEMNLLKSQGFSIAALSMIVIDNPLVAATGHRICNDCMKACIYQKQDPVNVPLVESNILEQVLDLPWGVEIYLLLTKWNPLNVDAPLPLLETGYNVLVTGLGPAGFALSHYLLNEGHNVTAIDGLKISPLGFEINKPIKFWQKIKIPLSKKSPQGFGGVAEYGITNRWDKNNLSLVRLILERRENFTIYGGIRLGSNITTSQAFAYGFDHIALCLGAGKPRYENLAGYFAKGVRSAADFLMNLQQGGAHLENSNSNLLIRMPCVVIGCGLTAIDSAAELIHYYPMQVEKFLVNWEKSAIFKENLGTEDLLIAEELIKHATLFRKAKNDAEKLQIIQELGGVTICYRKSIKDSPAYRLNAEEIEHALALGIKFEENVSPKEICTDKFGYSEWIKFTTGKEVKARSVLIAIGTDNNEFQDIDELSSILCKDSFRSNTALRHSRGGGNLERLSLDSRLRGNDKERRGNDLEEHKRDLQNSLGSFKWSEGISYFGDCNPKYAGSVVRALASAKNGYKAISQELSKNKPRNLTDIKKDLKSTISKVNILSDGIVELLVHSPMAARNFKPGQFFKLQNYSNDITKLMEPIALTGAYVDKQRGIISLIVLEMGQSSKLCRNLKEEDEVVLMGPTGSGTKIVENKKVALVGGGLGNAVLLAIGQALKANNCTITYFAGYKKTHNRFYPEKIEEFADRVFWSSQEDEFTPRRAQDFTVHGNIIESIGQAKICGIIDGIEHVICAGSEQMMRAVSEKKLELFGNIEMICSLNSPMQCMMKGICGQCIQKVDDERGYIFSCACQDQNSDVIDFNSLSNRLSANSLLEKIT